jgi:hypothetical protein
VTLAISGEPHLGGDVDRVPVAALRDDLADDPLAIAAQVQVRSVEVVEPRSKARRNRSGLSEFITPKLISGIFRPVRPRTRYEISGVEASCSAAAASCGTAREQPVSSSPADTTPVAAPPMNQRLLTPSFFIPPPPFQIAVSAIDALPLSQAILRVRGISVCERL